MSLYKIIKALQAAQGSNSKQAVLEANKGNELLKAYLKATYDPALSYYQKAAPKPTGIGAIEFNIWEMVEVTGMLAGRSVTGKAAISFLLSTLNMLNAEGQELLTLLISRSVGAGVGDTMILKTWPDLYFIPGYMRCSLMTPKIKKHFEGLEEIIAQKKADGSFVYVKKPLEGTATAFTRAGTAYPQWLVNHLIKGAPEGSYVYVGELLIYKNGKLLDRQTGNGIYNSILKGADEKDFKEHNFLMEAWDLLPICDFEVGLCEIEYKERFASLHKCTLTTENIQTIDTDIVANLGDAYNVYSSYTAAGYEGAVIKDPHSVWKDHTSPYNVKLKIAFEIDLLITNINEGTGKAKGMMGSVSVQSREGKITSDVGTGWTDEERREVWENRGSYIHGILTVKANDIIGNRNDGFFSLFLPVAVEIRLDKKIADTYDECAAQLNAAKGGL